ncbi:MAG: glycosyltransferase [Candidatus Edwardsbacteria bacterium]|nr:glycosyltransferase [Candidatus Edwardsbacteria bacterium]
MKRVLVLSYYFPPLGMSGVQRMLKFVKYLPQSGWQPIVITPDHRGSYGYDAALLDQIPSTRIVRTRSIDPLFLSPRRGDPQAMNRHRGLVSAISAGCLPDNKIGWIPFAVAAGLKIARQVPITAVFSTAPPYSSHLAALLIARSIGRPLVVDYRDAWSQPNPLSHVPTALHRRLQRSLERLVQRHAALTIAINREILAGMPRTDGNRPTGLVLPHGYDPDDFTGPDPRPSPHGFVIAYSGTFIGDRGPVVLAKAVADLRRRRPDLATGVRIDVAGAHRPQDLRAVAHLGVGDLFVFRSFLPHRQAIELIRRADALWLIIAAAEGPTVSTGKLYEYLGARRPILASVPGRCAAAAIVRETSTGVIIDPGDHRRLSAEIERLIVAKLTGRRAYRPDFRAIAGYDRRVIAGALARRLDRCAALTGSPRGGVE